MARLRAELRRAERLLRRGSPRPRLVQEFGFQILFQYFLLLNSQFFFESQVMKIKAYQLSSKPEVPDHEIGDMDRRSGISTVFPRRKEILRSHTFAAAPFGPTERCQGEGLADCFDSLAIQVLDCLKLFQRHMLRVNMFFGLHCGFGTK